jgi:hypothetical protein
MHVRDRAPSASKGQTSRPPVETMHLWISVAATAAAAGRCFVSALKYSLIARAAIQRGKKIIITQGSEKYIRSRQKLVISNGRLSNKLSLCN